MLLDIQLPGIGGLDVLARCVAKQPALKIIVMTGADTTETVLAALRGQAYDFISKPIEPSHLINVVKRAVTTGLAGRGESRARPASSSCGNGLSSF